jgi:hypothetical protein
MSHWLKAHVVELFALIISGLALGLSLWSISVNSSQNSDNQYLAVVVSRIATCRELSDYYNRMGLSDRERPSINLSRKLALELAKGLPVQDLKENITTINGNPDYAVPDDGVLNLVC